MHDILLLEVPYYVFVKYLGNNTQRKKQANKKESKRNIYANNEEIKANDSIQ